MRPNNDQTKTGTPGSSISKNTPGRQSTSPVTEAFDYRYVFGCPSSNDIDSSVSCLNNPTVGVNQSDINTYQTQGNKPQLTGRRRNSILVSPGSNI